MRMLAYGLEDAFSEKPEIGIMRRAGGLGRVPHKSGAGSERV